MLPFASMSVRALVTGGAGFLGSHLCERLLSSGREVVCLDDLSTGRLDNVAQLLTRPGFEFVAHDVAAPCTNRVAAASEIYHLASPAAPMAYQRDRVRTLKTNVLGTLRALEAAQAWNARLLLASTSEVYGDPEEHPQSEAYRGAVASIGPRACYDNAKRAAETLASDYAQQYGVPVRIARIFSTYGPRMRADDGRMVATFIAAALNDAPIPITVYGDGAQTRTLCYVADLIDGLVRLLASDDAGHYPVNLGADTELTVLAIAQRVVRHARSRSPIVFQPLPQHDPRRRRPVLARARAVIGWQPTTPLADGLDATIEHFRHELDVTTATTNEEKLCA